MSESPTPREDLLSIFQDIAERWDAGIKAGWLLAQLEDRIAEYDPRITRIIRALDATALAEAEARGRRQVLEEADDREVKRILGLTEAQVIAEIKAEGRDPEALAEAMRGQMGATFTLCSEIARLTGDLKVANEACDRAAMSGGFYAKHAETYLARAEAAEAETARLRAALEDTRAAADELVPLCIAEGDTKGAGALQYVSGFISDRLAALTSQEKTDG